MNVIYGIITWCRGTEIPNPVSYILAGVYSSTDNFLSPILFLIGEYSKI